MRVEDHQVRMAIEAAGLVPGERFEVSALPTESGRAKGYRAIGERFTNTHDALAWLDRLDEDHDVYLILNPLRPDATFPRGRARDEDVQVVRCLLVEVDPGDPPSVGKDAADPRGTSPEKRAACREAAEGIRQHLLELDPAARVAWIDSGRGQQLWLHHEAMPPGDEANVLRAQALRNLARRHNRTGLCHVDTAVHNPARLARLPGTRNWKTGETARVIERGTT